jgi:hypothetical protein
MSEIVWGKFPVKGDKVYVDFGDSVLTGGEATGWLSNFADDWFTLVDASGAVIEQFHLSEAVHIEVMED